MNKIVAIIVALFFAQAVSAQNDKKNFEPKTKTEHILFAIAAIEHDSDLVAALAYINEAISEDPNNYFSYAVRGNIYLLQKEYYLALEDFYRILSANPDDISSLLARAKCWYYLKDYESALKDLNEAISLEPFDGDVYLWRSKVKKVLGDNVGAEADAKIYQKMNE
jgi:Tfp pilus assembly protein PilF